MLSFKEVHVAAAADVDVVITDDDDELVGDFDNSVLTPHKLPFLDDVLREKRRENDIFSQALHKNEGF